MVTVIGLFVGKDGACSLEKAGRSRFYAAWYGEAEDFLHQPMRDSLAVLLRKLRQYRVIRNAENMSD